MIDILPTAGKVKRAYQRVKKHVYKELWQASHLGFRHHRTPILIFGCHRSGTGMMQRTLDMSPFTKLYGETRKGITQRRARLTAEDIKRRTARTFASHSVFKPLNDAQNADKFLAALPNLTSIWMFRDFRDVANSMVNHWGDHPLDVIRRIALWEWKKVDEKTGEIWDWRRDRLSERMIEVCRRFYGEDMLPQEAAVLFWWIRNQFFFDLGLDKHSRVLLVRYEHLVSDKFSQFEAVFEFVGLPFKPQFVDDVVISSIGKHEFPVITPGIEKLAVDMLGRLIATYDEQQAQK